ncbi:MAG: hypothetical protein R3D33_02880 [Hyphomicrobiaceae bacterium]
MSSFIAGGLVAGIAFGTLFALLFPFFYRFAPLSTPESRKAIAEMPVKARVGLGLLSGGMFGASMAVDSVIASAGLARSTAWGIEAMMLIGIGGAVLLISAMSRKAASSASGS